MGFVVVLSGGLLQATTLSSNLSNTTAGAEVASGSTWLTASFRTGTESDSLSNMTLLLSNPTSGVAEVDLYSDSLLAPGSLVGTLTSPTSFSSDLSATTFTTTALALASNSTYWIVLKAISGEFDWAWTSDNTGIGKGFQGTWGVSADAGSTWFTYAVYPTQFSVVTSNAATVTPEPRTLWPALTALGIGSLFLARKRRVPTCLFKEEGKK